MTFFTGFLSATLVGVIANLFAQSWDTIRVTLKQMHSPPNPVLKPTRQANIKGIGVSPEESPIQVLNNGCLKIVLHLLLQLIVLIGIATFAWLMPGRDIVKQEVPEEFLAGIAFAGILGFLLNSLSHNWGAIGNLYNKMVNPPVPALNRATPPNNHYVAAKPPQSPYDVVAGGCIEIILRVVWQILLIALLGLTLWGIYRYLFG